MEPTPKRREKLFQLPKMEVQYLSEHLTHNFTLTESEYLTHRDINLFAIQTPCISSMIIFKIKTIKKPSWFFVCYVNDLILRNTNTNNLIT